MLARGLLVLAFTSGLVLSPRVARAETVPSPSPTSTVEDPSVFDVGGRIRASISEWFGDLVASALGPVFDLMGRTVFSTPDIAEDQRIKDLWGFSLGIADATLLMFLLAGAAVVTATGGSELSLSAKELLPRFLIAGASANLSWLVLRELTDLSNALSREVLGAIDQEALGRRFAESLFSGSMLNPFLALLTLVVVVLGVLVIVTYVIRIAVLVVFATAAPLLLITHCLPQTDLWARTWWRVTIALLAVPVAQSFLVTAAFRVFLADGGILGFTSGSLINLLVLGAILYLLFKIPVWALNAALSGAVSSAWSRTKGVAKTAAKAVAA